MFATSSLLPHWNFKLPGPSWCCSNLVWQVREPLTWLSPKNPVADLAITGPGVAATLVPTLVPGTYCPEARSLPSGFSMSSTIFGLQSSYRLGYCWLFSVFLRRLGRCFHMCAGGSGLCSHICCHHLPSYYCCFKLLSLAIYLLHSNRKLFHLADSLKFSLFGPLISIGNQGV